MRQVLICTLFGIICGLLNGYLSWQPAIHAGTDMVAHYMQHAWGLTLMGLVGGLTVIYVTR